MGLLRCGRKDRFTAFKNYFSPLNFFIGVAYDFSSRYDSNWITTPGSDVSLVGCAEVPTSCMSCPGMMIFPFEMDMLCVTSTAISAAISCIRTVWIARLSVRLNASVWYSPKTPTVFALPILTDISQRGML